eukprot:tig00020908_g15305.t1
MNRSGLESLPDDLLLDVVRRLAAADGLQALALGLGRTSRILRTASWHPSLYEEPAFSRDESARFIVAACRRMGKHVRRLCFSGLPQLSEKDIGRCLAAAPCLTHLSLAFLARGVSNSNPQAFAFESLPPLPRLELFNAAAVSLSGAALDSLLASCAGTLRHLYLPSTQILAPPPLPHCALDIIVRHSLPELVSLDLADAPVSEAALRALLVGTRRPAAPRLRHLFLVWARIGDGGLIGNRGFAGGGGGGGGGLFGGGGGGGLFGGGGGGGGLFGGGGDDLFGALTSALAAPSSDPTDVRKVLESVSPPDLQVHVDDPDERLSRLLLALTTLTSTSTTPYSVENVLAALPKDVPCAGLDGPDPDGMTPFLKAIQAGRLDVAGALVEAGASPLCCTLPGPWRRQPRPWDAPFPMRAAASRSPGPAGRTALHFAASLERGRRAAGHFGAGAVEREDAAHPPEEWLEALRGWGLAALADARTFDSDETPLMVRTDLEKLKTACEPRAQAIRDSSKAARLLLALGADPAATNGAGDTAAHVSAERNEGRALAELLAARPAVSALRGARACTPSSYAEGRTPLLRAASKWFVADTAVRALLGAAAGRPGAGAGTGAGAGAAAAPLELLAAGRDGRTVLHFACGTCFPDLVARAGPEALQARDARGRTPLIAAAERGDERAARALLARPETEVDAVDAAGRTALLAACAASAPALALLLLERGADPARRPPGGPPPLLALLRPAPPQPTAAAPAPFVPFRPLGGGRGEERDREVEEEEGVQRVPEERRAALNAALTALWSRGERVDGSTDEHGYTVFHYVAALKAEVPLKEILAACPDPAAALAVPDPLGRTPLALACRRGRHGAAAAFLTLSNPLAQARAAGSPEPLELPGPAHLTPPGSQDLEGNCCLHVGRFGFGSNKGGFPLVSAILRRCPAAARLRNADGETPLHRLAARRPWRQAPPDPAPGASHGEGRAIPAPAPPRAGAAGGMFAPSSGPLFGPPELDWDAMGRAARDLVAASDLAAQDAAGRTPIHAAVAAGRRVGVLLAAMLAAPQARAALALQDRAGSTPLHTACRGLLPGEAGPERSRRLVRRWLAGDLERGKFKGAAGPRPQPRPRPRSWSDAAETEAEPEDGAPYPEPRVGALQQGAGARSEAVASDSCPSDDPDLLL